MEAKNDKPSKKIITTDDAHNYLIQSIELKLLKKNDCFFVIYLDENTEVLYIKTIEKKKTDSEIELVGQILEFDKTLNVCSLIVFHKPLKNKGIDAETAIANLLIDKAYFACVNVLDYQWLFHEKYSHSMHVHKNVNFGKHRYAQKRTIKKIEQYTSSTNIRELFDLDVLSLKSIIELEYEKISSADSFLMWKIIDVNFDKYRELRFRSTRPYDFEMPLTKMYLVGIFRDYMKAKDRIVEFIDKSNLYDRYLLYQFDSSEYRKMKDKEKAKMEEKLNVPPSKLIHTFEKNQTFKPGQKVLCNRFAEINHKLASGLKFNTIYTIKEVVTCPDCGSNLLVLDGTFDSTVTSRICVCGKDDFHPNAFASARFAVVNLQITHKKPVLV